MQLLPSSAAAAAATLSLLLHLLSFAEAHNITRILAKFPEFSEFNHLLTTTHLAAEINSRQTITVLAVDNAAMAALTSKHLPAASLKDVLSLHVVLDYFGAKKLHQITNGTALSATMFQATGSAPGTAGFVNITDLRGGRVSFAAADAPALGANFVKSVHELPYNISVLQISKLLTSPSAEAPTPAPAQQNLTALMSKHGCKLFAETLASVPAAAGEFDRALPGGLTVFCPLDEPFKRFLPKFKNLTAAGREALLEYHGVAFYESVAMLKSSNGPQNTLATDGASKYAITVQNDGEKVTLQTKLLTATITDTLVDDDPLAVYGIDKVLMPRELFKTSGEAPSPAPAPAAEAPGKAGGKKKAPKKKGAAAPSEEEADAPAPSDDDPADQTADKNGAVRFEFAGAVWWSLLIGLFLLM